MENLRPTVQDIENQTVDSSLCITSEFTVTLGTTIINCSDIIKHNSISPYSFINKTVWHMAGNLTINGNIDGGNTVALSRVYGFANFTRFEHNGKMTNDGTTFLIENNQAGDNEFIFNGIYETTNPEVFKIAGSNKRCFV